MKKWMSGLLAGASAVSMLAVPVQAQGTEPFKVIIDGKEQAFEVQPIEQNGRLMVPWVSLIKGLGAQPFSHQKEGKHTFVALRGDDTMTLELGVREAVINGQKVALEQPAALIRNQPMVPLRAVSEALRADVSWQPVSRTVVITTQPAAQHEQTLHLPLGEVPITLDPIQAFDLESMAVLRQLGDGLVRLDEYGAALPGMADRWEVSPNGLSYKFHLRDAQWSDGKPVMAQDFEYAWKRAIDPESRSNWSFLFSLIEGADEFNSGKASADSVRVKALDDKTLEVHLKQQAPWFTSMLAEPVFFPQRADVVRRLGEDYGQSVLYLPQDIPVNGPFRVLGGAQNLFLALQENPLYWDKDAVKLERVEMAPMYEEAAETAFAQQLIDYMPLSASKQPSYASDPNMHLTQEPIVWYLEFNQRAKVLTNANVRKALTYAIDREGYLQDAAATPSMRPAAGFIPWGVSDNGVDANGVGGKTYRETAGDLLQAKERLDEARAILQKGLSELGLSEFPKLNLLTGEATMRKQAEYFAAEWREHLGIDISVEAVKTAERFQRVDRGEYDITVSGWAQDYNDPLNFLELYETGSSLNRSGYSNQAYDQAVQRVRTETDDRVRPAQIKQAEQILLGDMAVGPVFFSEQAYLLQPTVKGMIVHGNKKFDLKQAYIEGKK